MSMVEAWQHRRNIVYTTGPLFNFQVLLAWGFIFNYLFRCQGQAKGKELKDNVVIDISQFKLKSRIIAFGHSPLFRWHGVLGLVLVVIGMGMNMLWHPQLCPWLCVYRQLARAKLVLMEVVVGFCCCSNKIDRLDIAKIVQWLNYVF